MNVGHFRAMNPPKGTDDKGKKKASSQEYDGTPDTTSAELLNSHVNNGTPHSLKPKNNK